MSAPKFTPGPWRIERCSCGSEFCHKYGTTNGAFYQGNGYPLDDARLIAAAPELYQAVAMLVEWWDREEAGPQYSDPDGRKGPNGEQESSAWFYGNVNLAGETHKLARAALAKARGEA